MLLAVAFAAGVVVVVPFALAAHQEGSSGQDAVGQIDRAKDIAAQATLQTAASTATAYFAESGSFQGFGPQAASLLDPSIRYTAGVARPDVVSIRGVTATSVALVTSTGSAYLCVGITGGVVDRGRVNAQTAAACTGGW